MILMRFDGDGFLMKINYAFSLSPYEKTGSVPVKPASGSSSRSTSPSASSGVVHSFIPTPRSSIPSAPSSARSSLHEKHLNNAK
jgi:hypothetical protein